MPSTQDYLNTKLGSVGLSIQQALQRLAGFYEIGLVGARLATTAALPAFTHNNGASGVGATLTANAAGVLTVDGSVVVLGDRILCKNGANKVTDGIFVCTTEGTELVAFVLTRATDFDTATKVKWGSFIQISEGTVNAGKLFQMTQRAAITMGTTQILFGGKESISTRTAAQMYAGVVNVSTQDALNTKATKVGLSIQEASKNL